MRHRPTKLLAPLFLALTAVVACSVETPTKVHVTATDTTCTASRSEAKSGEITFEAENKGTVFTEVYLYGPGDRIMNERENIDPGQTKDFTVKVGGGSYEIACKPGMVGDGIRTPFTVSGTPDPRLSEPIDCATARGRQQFSASVSMTDTGFAVPLTDICVVKGQAVSFLIENTGSAPHVFAVLAPDGSKLGESSSIAPGGSAELKLSFTTIGTYRAIDPTGDNRQKGFETSFTVID